MSLKLHFTSDKYNITTAKNAVRCKQETFMKRKDVLLFRKLSKKYEKKELIDFFVANFVAGHNGVFDANASEIYTSWMARQGKLTYQFTQDAELLVSEGNKCAQNPLISEDGQHPIVLKLVLGKKITLESAIILDKITDFVYSNDTTLKDDIIWKDFSRLVRKYRIFINIDKNKFNVICNNLGVIRSNNGQITP